MTEHAPRPAPPLEAVRIGFAMARARILRRATLLVALLAAALVVTSSIIERHHTTSGAVDRTLVATFGLVLPLVCFALSLASTERLSLRDAAWPAARYGVARRDVALGVVAASMLASIALSAPLAMLAVLAAHGPGNPPAIGDALTSAWIAALTSAAYAGWMALGATFGKRGGARLAVVVIDFVAGSGAGVLGAIFPRGNAQSLLGFAAPLGMAQASSSVVLGLMAVVLGVVAALRCRE